MTRADLIERICEKGHMPRPRAELLVNTVFDCLEQSMRRGEKIEVRGFGRFQIRSYRAYKGRNPRTGQLVAARLSISRQVPPTGRLTASTSPAELTYVLAALHRLRGASPGPTSVLDAQT
jgi:integration host factor subunit beta